MNINSKVDNISSNQQQQGLPESKCIRLDHSNFNYNKDGFQMQNLFKNINFAKQSKNSFGQLHPQYINPLQLGYKSIQDYNRLHSYDVLNNIRQIDLLCIKTSDRKYEKYYKCKQIMDNKIHKNILIPFVNSMVHIHKVSNICMLKNNNIDICSRLVVDNMNFMFKLAKQKIQFIKNQLKAEVPANVDAPLLFKKFMNNQFDQEAKME